MYFIHTCIYTNLALTPPFAVSHINANKPNAKSDEKRWFIFISYIPALNACAPGSINGTLSIHFCFIWIETDSKCFHPYNRDGGKTEEGRVATWTELYTRNVSNFRFLLKIDVHDSEKISRKKKTTTITANKTVIA